MGNQRQLRKPRTALAAAAAVLAVLTACAAPTPYGPEQNGKGYAQQQLEEARYRVSFAGNSLTPRETVENYLLYRAAEITLESGNDHFRVVDQDVDEKTRFRTTLSGFGHGFHRFSYRHRFFGTSFASSTTRPITSYEAYANIVVVPGEKPSEDDRAYNARDVIEKLSPTIVRPQTTSG